MAAIETRGDRRANLYLFAQIEFEQDNTVRRIKLRNISSGGMMGEAEFRVASGSRLKVDFKNYGVVGASVAWVQGNRFGIAFDEEVDPELVRKELRPKPQNSPAIENYPRAHGLRPPNPGDRLHKI